MWSAIQQQRDGGPWDKVVKKKPVKYVELWKAVVWW